jgi:glutaredoxin-related protein
MTEVVVYYASVSATAKTKKDTQNLKWLLEKKDVAFEMVDVARDPVARGTIKKKSGKNTLPQLYVDGKYVGVSIEHHSNFKTRANKLTDLQGYDEIQEFEEQDLLDDVLDGNGPN